MKGPDGELGGAEEGGSQRHTSACSVAVTSRARLPQPGCCSPGKNLGRARPGPDTTQGPAAPLRVPGTMDGLSGGQTGAFTKGSLGAGAAVCPPLLLWERPGCSSPLAQRLGLLATSPSPSCFPQGLAGKATADSSTSPAHDSWTDRVACPAALMDSRTRKRLQRAPAQYPPESQGRGQEPLRCHGHRTGEGHHTGTTEPQVGSAFPGSPPQSGQSDACWESGVHSGSLEA